MLLRPTAKNLAFRTLRASVGPGRKRPAAVRFAVVLSLLPSETFHEGPPACEHGLVLLLFWYVMQTIYVI